MAKPTPFRLALAILIAAAGTIAGAWMIQAFGHAPCELCLKERIPYYAGVPLAALAAMLSRRGTNPFLAAAFAGLVLIFLGGAGLGVYHSGVEFGFWQGPSDCSRAQDHAGSVNDFLKQLQTVRVVRCDQVSLRVLGLSLAVWNAVIMTLLAALATAGLYFARRVRVGHEKPVST